MRIYVASSWRNSSQPHIVASLRRAGFEVYDFKDPHDNGGSGFAWSDIDPAWQSWGTDDYMEKIKHSLAKHGFECDMEALREADVCVLVLPCGCSAHLELGWAAGRSDKKTAILLCKDVPEEPELMYKMADFITDDLGNLIAWLGIPA